jgi:DNA-binding XRE family transcriptional regulator
MVNFGAIIKKYREQLDVTQKQLANSLNVTATYLSAVENGRKEPSLALIKKICSSLKLPEEVLFWESVDIRNGLTREERKTIEIAKVIIKSYYENLKVASA